MLTPDQKWKTLKAALIEKMKASGKLVPLKKAVKNGLAFTRPSNPALVHGVVFMKPNEDVVFTLTSIDGVEGTRFAGSMKTGRGGDKEEFLAHLSRLTDMDKMPRYVSDILGHLEDATYDVVRVNTPDVIRKYFVERYNSLKGADNIRALSIPKQGTEELLFPIHTYPTLSIEFQGSSFSFTVITTGHKRVGPFSLKSLAQLSTPDLEAKLDSFFKMMFPAWVQKEMAKNESAVNSAKQQQVVAKKQEMAREKILAYMKEGFEQLKGAGKVYSEGRAMTFMITNPNPKKGYQQTPVLTANGDDTLVFMRDMYEILPSQFQFNTVHVKLADWVNYSDAEFKIALSRLFDSVFTPDLIKAIANASTMREQAILQAKEEEAAQKKRDAWGSGYFHNPNESRNRPSDIPESMRTKRHVGLFGRDPIRREENDDYDDDY
jgi:hypothetical protein